MPDETQDKASTEVAQATAAQLPAFLKGVKIKKRVTLPLWKWEDGIPKYMKFDGIIHKGKKLKGEGQEKMEPADLANVIDLATGEVALIICNAVLKSSLEEEYNDDYVGKCFAIRRFEKQGDKDYNTFEIVEIEDPTPKKS